MLFAKKRNRSCNIKRDNLRGGGIVLALSYRNFRIYTAGNAPSLIGVWAQRLASGWMMWEMTKSPAMLGWLGFVDLIPFVVVSPFAGLLTDKIDKIILAQNRF